MTAQQLSRITELRAEVEQRKGKFELAKEHLSNAEKKLAELRARRGHLEEAQAIIQVVAQQTQQELEYRISELVSLALQVVFPKPYKLILRFEARRGRSEADLLFVDEEGNEVTPLDAAGGGCVDVATLALRCSMWSLRRPRQRGTILMDEPLKNINDDTRTMHRKAAEIIAEISRKLDLQFIIVSQLTELKDIADKCFHVTKTGKCSTVEGK